MPGNELFIAIILAHIGLTYCNQIAFGQMSVTSLAISSNTGIVLSALIIPPMPRVSAIVCRNPYWLGISKSMTVEGL